MPFIDIYNLVVSHVGTSAAQKPYIKTLINRAAEDLYTQNDLVNCLREQTFVRTNPDDVQAICQWTLPFYVWKIRGVREYNTGLQIVNHDMRPRYQTQGWKEFIDPFLYRVKTEQVLKRDIDNEGRVTISLPDGEQVSADGGFSLYITGSNVSKTRFTEEVIFAAGDLTKVTTNLFSTIDSIRKSIQTEFDLSLFDADGNEISFIPNCEFSPTFTLIQAADDNFWSPQYIEVLYKTKFYPFDNDSDSFPCGNIYDTALYYKTLEYYYAKKSDVEKVQQFYAKVTDLCTNIAQNFNANNEKLLDYGPNQYLNMLPSKLSNTPLSPYFRFAVTRSY